jgi:nucleotide-binding universal stress UspA family protein
MNKILVPIDFSDTSKRVLSYVAALTHDVPVDQVTVLRSTYPSIYEQIFPSADYFQVDAESAEMQQEQQEAVREHINTFLAEFLKDVSSQTKVEIGISEEPLLRSIIELTSQQKFNGIVISSDQTNGEEGYVAEQVIAVVKTSPVPVLVIPPKAVYKPLKKALLPVDFRALHRLTALSDLFTLRKDIKPELTILNVAADTATEQADPVVVNRLHELIDDKYPYSIVVSGNRDVLHGILDFSQKNDLQLIVALRGKYSFLNNLTHRSITEALALNAIHPVLVLK